MRTRMWLTVITAALVGVWPMVSVADDVVGTSTTQSQNQAVSAGANTIFDSTQLTKLKSYNARNENLGKVDDLIIDAHTGQVLYGILDTGLFGKSVPIPWPALQIRVTDNKYWFFLNKSKDEMANAPSFSKSQPPSFVDSQWRQSVDKFFGVHTVARPAESTAEHNQANQGHTGSQMTADQMILRSSKLADLKVYNRQDVKLGKVDNLIIDTHASQVLYGILDTGVGGHRIPVPWSAFWLGKEVNRDNYWLIVDKSQDQLANAPTFDSRHWPDFTSPQWRSTLDNFFGVRTASQPRSETNR